MIKRGLYRKEKAMGEPNQIINHAYFLLLLLSGDFKGNSKLNIPVNINFNFFLKILQLQLLSQKVTYFQFLLQLSLMEIEKNKNLCKKM